MEHLREIRMYELEQVVGLFPPGARLLEIGAGAGWQAKELAHRGFKVEAIDLPTSCYAVNQVWPVTQYDGFSIPFPDGYFDVVFSSNTLEHIPHLEGFQQEIKRVLVPQSGFAIHILPTASWRLWTSISHYIFVLRSGFVALGILRDRGELDVFEKTRKKNSPLGVLKKAIAPPRHGELGNASSELWRFSKYGWLGMFHRTGWEVEEFFSLGLFYTGYSVIGARMGMSTRRFLSRWVGSSTIAYVVKANTFRVDR